MKKVYTIDGMHCKACELLVKKGCEKLGGCTVETVNHKKGEVVIQRRGKEQKKAFEHVLEKCGYCLCDKTQQKAPQPQKPWIDRLAFVLLALVLTFVLIQVDVLGFMTSLSGGTGLGVIFVLGLVASVSTCLAVTGGVIMGFTELVDESTGWRGHVKVHGSFQLGRIGGFFILGALLGLLGQQVSIGLGFASWMNAFIAIVFVYLGLQLLGFVPSVSSFGIHLPDKRTTKILSSRNPYFAPIVGALTFFLPCGFTQSVQLMALASGSRWMGGMMMAMFAIGTLPGLLALGMGTSFAKDHRKQGFEYIVAVLLLVFGLFTFWGSARIWGRVDTLSGSGISTSTNTVEDTEQGAKRAMQKISLGHNGSQLVPASTTLSAGKDYEITITPEQDGLGCMNSILLPRVDSTSKRVQKGVPLTYTLKNLAPGKYSFVCGAMGMKQGEIVIN